MNILEILTGEQFVKDLVAVALNEALSDENWKCFGFKGKPKQSLFKHYKNEQKKKETFLKRELMISSICVALLFLPEQYTFSFKRKVFIQVFDEILSENGIPEYLEFPDGESAFRYYVEGAEMYLGQKETIADFPYIFSTRAKECFGGVPPYLAAMGLLSGRFLRIKDYVLLITKNEIIDDIVIPEKRNAFIPDED